MYFSFFMFFTHSCHILVPKVSVSHFPRFSFFSPHYSSYSEHFSFTTIFSVSHHIPGPTVCISHFPGFSVFLPYTRFYSVRFLFSMFYIHVLQFYRYITGPTVYISHFSWFSVFLSIFQVIQCLCLIFHVFQFSRHNPGPP